MDLNYHSRPKESYLCFFIACVETEGQFFRSQVVVVSGRSPVALSDRSPCWVSAAAMRPGSRRVAPVPSWDRLLPAAPLTLDCKGGEGRLREASGGSFHDFRGLD